jgi:hypothetical protein
MCTYIGVWCLQSQYIGHGPAKTRNYGNLSIRAATTDGSGPANEARSADDRRLERTGSASSE